MNIFNHWMGEYIQSLGIGGKYFQSLTSEYIFNHWMGNTLNHWMEEIFLIIEYMFNHWIGEIFQPLDGGNYLSLDGKNIFNHRMGKYFQSLDGEICFIIG